MLRHLFTCQPSLEVANSICCTLSTDNVVLLLWLQAAAYGKEEMVQFLVEHGANALQPDDFKRTAIDEAKERNHLNILALLEESLLNNLPESSSNWDLYAWAMAVCSFLSMCHV